MAIDLKLEGKPWYHALAYGLVIGGLLAGAVHYAWFRGLNAEIKGKRTQLEALQQEIQKGRAAERKLSQFREEVRRLRALNDVARSKDARVRRPVSSIDAWAARSRVELDAALHGELMVGNPIAGEDNRVTRDLSRPACVQLEQVDLLDAPAPVDCRDLCARRQRRAVAQRRRRSRERQ